MGLVSIESSEGKRTNGGPAIQVDGQDNCKLQPHMKGRSPIGGVMKRNGKWYGIRG